MNRSNLISIPVIPEEWISTEIDIFVLQKNKSESKENPAKISECGHLKENMCPGNSASFQKKKTSTPWARIYYEVQLTVVMLELPITVTLPSRVY